MKKYKVTFYIEYFVEADDENEALDEAEGILAKDFENSHCGLTEMFNSKVIEIKRMGF